MISAPDRVDLLLRLDRIEGMLATARRLGQHDRAADLSRQAAQLRAMLTKNDWEAA